MSNTFWVAKYIDDPFRNEQRNVGVFVNVAGHLVGKFVGERDDGALDGRMLRGQFAHTAVYTQWRDFWRKCIRTGEIGTALGAATQNFLVVEGGDVSGTDGDAPTEVCSYLFDLIVSGGRVAQAYGWDDDEVRDKSLAEEIYSSLSSMHLLASGETLLASHPIVQEMEIQGERVKHKPSYAQRNGHLSVIEYIDLGGVKTKPIRERAGWMAYMFEDIVNMQKGAEAFSIVRPEKDDAGDAVAYAKTVLEDTSTVINWNDTNARGVFLQKLKRVAVSLE